MRLGIDIGGTDIKFGVIDEEYSVIYKESIPTRSQKTDREVVDDIITVCRKLTGTYKIKSIGMGSPGIVDTKKGIVKAAYNLPFTGTPIALWLREEFKLPVFVENDANCAVWGEMQSGKGKNANNLVMLTLGTGIGGGIIIDKKMYSGRNGAAGEFGHMSIQFDGRKCSCGRKGCWEQYASTRALIQQTKAAMNQHPDSILSGMTGEVTGKTVFDAARRGCHIAEEVIKEYINYLSVGIINIIYLFRPDKIVLAGGITNQGEHFLNRLGECRNMGAEIVISELKNDAGIIGAALLDKCQHAHKAAQK